MDLTQDADIQPLVERVLSRWRWLLISTLVGAAVGLGISLLRPPIYRAQAAIAVSNDYTLTGPLDLVVEDRALDRVHQLILSDDTLSKTLEALQPADPQNPAWTSVPALQQRLQLEQRLASWELAAIDRDPDTAARIANAWASIAMADLGTAREHAWKVMELRAAPVLVECFRMLSQPVREERYWECVTDSPALEPAQEAVLRVEVEASRGILPSLSFEWTEHAHPPTRPVAGDRGILVLAGATLGLFAGVLVCAMTPRRPRTPPAADAVRGRENRS